MKIYYLGPIGSFSEQIGKKIYPDEKLISSETFDGIVKKVENDSDAIGLLVIENSISSSVHQSVDLMFESKAQIIGEAFMEITLDLIGLPGTNINDVQTVYSHPQALSQCSEFIEKFNLKPMFAQSTASAASYVKRSGKVQNAAIGSKYLADLMKMQVIKENVGNVKHNMSRWILIAKESKIKDDEVNKLTVIFKVKHEPGSLVKVLDRIAKKRGNLTKIESRPISGTNWEYEFWVDIETPNGSKKDFFKLFENEALEYRVIGQYQKGKKVSARG